MLHQISWYTYVVSIISLAILYYLYVGLTFYKAELKALLNKFTGRQPAIKAAGNSDLQIPDYDIMGKAAPEAVEFVTQEELSFGPPDDFEEQVRKAIPVSENNSRLIVNFSEMVSEVKTLIRVINESSETKENFEMLFRLIILKYPALRGTLYQQQINDFLMEEGAPAFSFSLNETDLVNYWTAEN